MRRILISNCFVWTLLICATGFFAPMANSGELEEGEIAFNSKDYPKAIKHFERAADQGSAVAEAYLGAMFHDGLGVDQNYTKAFYWSHKAANRGVVGTWFNVGLMYANGRGVAQSFTNAAIWYSKAAERGDPSAQANLSMLYASGEGVENDFMKAYFWASLAAKQGVKKAENLRESLAYLIMKPDQVERAKQLVEEWEPSR